jgi:tight adherence protein B
VLTLIPIFVAGTMAVVNPAYLQILLGNPFGKDLVLAAGICLLLAHLIIRRIVDIKF